MKTYVIEVTKDYPLSGMSAKTICDILYTYLTEWEPLHGEAPLRIGVYKEGVVDIVVLTEGVSEVHSPSAILNKQIDECKVVKFKLEEQ